MKSLQSEDEVTWEISGFHYIIKSSFQNQTRTFCIAFVILTLNALQTFFLTFFDSCFIIYMWILNFRVVTTLGYLPCREEKKMKNKKLTFKDFMRRTKWLFSNSGVVALGFEHFLAMVPATILVPILVNNTVGENVIDMSLVLFTSGIGTICFTIFSRGRIPAYLGSSFAYIGLTIYLMESQIGDGIAPEMAYSYIGWAYIFSGLLLVLLSFLYKKSNIDRFLTFILPASVVGPAISLIGLELADTAVVDSGFDVVNGLVDANAALVSIVTLFVIVLFSLIKNRIWKNAAIIVGMFIGYLMFFITNGFPDMNFDVVDLISITVPKFNLPLLSFPKSWLSLLISVVPATFIIFTENIGRVTVINRMVNHDDVETGIFNKNSIKQLHKGLLSHGLSTIAVTFIGSVPNTIYAENIAVMGIHDTEAKHDPDKMIRDLTRPFSIYPYIVAAVIAILFSFAGILQSFLLNIPKAVIGGMELFLFGIISAPGIQLLVDQRVNYKKISNQIITAAVLISGVSGLSVNFSVVELKGMSLGFVVGILLNLLVQLLKWIGNTSDAISFDEVLEECLGAMVGKASDAPNDARMLELKFDERSICMVDASDLFLAFKGATTRVLVDSVMESADWAIDAAKHASCARVMDSEHLLFTVRKTANSLIVEFDESMIDDDTKIMVLNDYPEAIDTDDSTIRIDVAASIPMRKVRELVRIATKKNTA